MAVIKNTRLRSIQARFGVSFSKMAKRGGLNEVYLEALCHCYPAICT